MARLIPTVRSSPVVGGVLLPLWGLLLTGCDDATAEEGGGEVAVVTAALSTTAAAALGVESLTNWVASSGTASLEAQRTQGQSALALAGPVNYTTITGRPLAMTAADLAPLTQSGGFVAIDLLLPTQQPNPFWLGHAQMFLSCPERGVTNQPLGLVELTGKRTGIFLTHRFAVPDFVRQQLAAKSCSNFSLTFALNLPSAGTGVYRIDNIRFKGPNDPGSTGTGASVELLARRTVAPAASVPGTATFAEGRIQVPASFHVAQGGAGTAQLTLLLARTATDRTTCTYAGASAGTKYDFVSCSRGERAGDLVISTSATLTVVGSDASAGDTKVKAQLAINPTGDELVAGLTPIPTFWGNTAAEVGAISATYFNSVAAADPRDGATVTLTTPEIAKAPPGVRVRDLLDPNAPPLSPTDPPFDQYGDVGGSDLANAYWRLRGAVDGSQQGERFVTAVNAEASVHGVLLGVDQEILKATVVYDSDSGTVGPTGRAGGSRTGDVKLFLFGGEVPPGRSLDESVSRSTIFDESTGYSIPVFEFGIFRISVGLTASVGVELETVAAVDGLQITLIPKAIVSATIDGTVDLFVASGGIDATIEIINVMLPISARALWAINTSPATCSAALDFLVDATYTVSHGAGEIGAHVTFGNCGIFGLCHTERWPIFPWGPLASVSDSFVHIQLTLDAIALPRTICDQPLTKAIDCVADNATLISGLRTSFGSTAIEPGSAPPGGIAIDKDIPCAQRTWSITPSSQGDVIEQSGCKPIVRFGTPGPRTVTMTATNGFQTVTATKPVVIVAATGTTPFARILNPVEGCVANLSPADVTLSAAAIDPDGQTPISYKWEFISSDSTTPQLVGTGETFVWNTPQASLDGTLRLTATDAGGASTTATMPLTKAAVVN